MIWPFTERYQLITLQWPGRSNFWVLWSFHETLKDNLITWRQMLKTLLWPGNDLGHGCICEGYTPHGGTWWPGWYWRNRWWDEHVRDECPLERDERGGVIR